MASEGECGVPPDGRDAGARNSALNLEEDERLRISGAVSSRENLKQRRPQANSVFPRERPAAALGHPAASCPGPPPALRLRHPDAPPGRGAGEGPCLCPRAALGDQRSAFEPAANGSSVSHKHVASPVPHSRRSREFLKMGHTRVRVHTHSHSHSLTHAFPPFRIGTSSTEKENTPRPRPRG